MSRYKINRYIDRYKYLKERQAILKRKLLNDGKWAKYPSMSYSSEGKGNKISDSTANLVINKLELEEQYKLVQWELETILAPLQFMGEEDKKILNECFFNEKNATVFALEVSYSERTIYRKKKEVDKRYCELMEQIIS